MKDYTLATYESKLNLKILLLSSNHRSLESEIFFFKYVLKSVTFYNNTKYSADILDQIARNIADDP